MMAELATVISNEQIAKNIYDMYLSCPQTAAQTLAGQFLNIKCGDSYNAFLRRPISVCNVQDDIVRIIYEAKGEGTRLLAKYKKGDMVDVLTPLGNGFIIEGAAKNPVIIGGGIGAPPLLMVAKQLESPAVFLGFRNKELAILEQDFINAGATVSIATDDGSYGHHGFVTELAKRYIKDNGSDIIYACGPKPMLKAVQRLSKEMGVPCYLSMEERMGCGIGACLVCTCKTKAEGDGWKYSHVCKDGPVFNGDEVIFDD